MSQLHEYSNRVRDFIDQIPSNSKIEIKKIGYRMNTYSFQTLLLSISSRKHHLLSYRLIQLFLCVFVYNHYVQESLIINGII